MASRCSQVSVTQAEIEVDPSSARSVRRKRTQKSTVGVRHLCPNLGTDGAVRCAAPRASSAIPAQFTFSSTFFGIPRYLWRVDWLSTEPKGSPGKLLAITIGSFPTCTDCNWVLPLAGFTNCKNDQVYRVAVEYRGNSTWDWDDFRFGILTSDVILSSRTLRARKHPSNRTNPEHDWSWVRHEFTRGKDAAKLARKLTSHHADRPNSVYYAQKTADVASATLRLGESIPIDNAVILLGGRRRLEVPSVLSSARARKAYRLCAGGEAMIRTLCLCPSKNCASSGRILTLHPFEGTVGKPASALGETSWHQIDGVFRGSVRKPVYTCVYLRIPA
jgi:hypothetical protein